MVKTEDKHLAMLIKQLLPILGPITKDLLLKEAIYLAGTLLKDRSTSHSHKPDENMLLGKFWSRFRFEEWLAHVSKTYKARDKNEESALKAIKKALDDLKSDPSLFSGDPFGDFTYDHPTLAIAITRFRTCLDPQNEILFQTEGNIKSYALHKWFITGVTAYLQDELSYENLRKRVPDDSLTIDSHIVRVAVAGDAGFTNTAQRNLIRDINKLHEIVPFNLFIHLGDTYYASSDGEVLRNFLRPFAALKCKTQVALCGNHDLYHGEEGYLAVLDILEQPGRYLAIQTKHWIIACLDTAYGAQDIFRNNGQLDAEQFEWLVKLIDERGDKRVVLMSHHLPISGWSKSQTNTLMTQVAGLSKNIFAWYWGHEHVCATYPRNGYYGACVGNGVFQQNWSKPSKKAHPVEWSSDAWCTCFTPHLIPWLDNMHFWPHGFLELVLHEDKIVETYHIENTKLLHTRTLRIP